MFKSFVVFPRSNSILLQGGICGINQWGEAVSGGLGDGSSPVVSRGKAPVGGLKLKHCSNMQVKF